MRIDTSGNTLSRARLAAARAPHGELAHLTAMEALARAVYGNPVPLGRSTERLPVYVERLAHTLLTDPALAQEALAGQTPSLDAVYRDLPAAAPYSAPQASVDSTAMEQAHDTVTTRARRAAEQCRKRTTSAAERRLAAACAEIQVRPLTHSLQGGIHPFWPHLLATAADLARQVMSEHADEQDRAHREHDFADFAEAAMQHARRLHSTLIESEGSLDEELQTLTSTALADPRLLASLGTPSSDLTSHAPVPFPPALLNWLAEQAPTMSPLMRHTLAADTTPEGFTGLFGQLAKTLTANATGTTVPPTMRRLPVPPQWEQHTEAVGVLLDAAAADRRITGQLIANSPSNPLVLTTVRDFVYETVMNQSSAPDDDQELLKAVFGDTDRLDSLVTYVAAHTAQSARTALVPGPGALFAVQRGQQRFVCRGADLATWLGPGNDLRPADGDGTFALWSRGNGPVGTIQALPQQEADQFTAAAQGRTPDQATALLQERAQAWPALVALDEPVRQALTDFATLPPAARPGVLVPPVAITVTEPPHGEWDLEILHARPYPVGPQAGAAVGAILVQIRQWLDGHGELLEEFARWPAGDAEDAVQEVGAPDPVGSPGFAEHWLQVAAVGQWLRVIQQRLAEADTARPRDDALSQLGTLLRSVDNYLDRTAARGIPGPSSTELAAAAAAGPAPFDRPQDATAALADLKQTWHDWAQDLGPIEQQADEQYTIIRLHALLDDPRPGATPTGWYALLAQAGHLARAEAQTASERTDADRMLGWTALSDAIDTMRNRWAATMREMPDTAADAARQGGVLHLTRPALAPATPPTHAKDFTARHSYLITRTRQLRDKDGALRTEDRGDERTLLRLIDHLLTRHADITDGVSPVLPALLHEISERALTVWHAQADEGLRTHGDLFMSLNTLAGRQAAAVQSLVDEADPHVREEAAQLATQAAADDQLMATITHTASPAADVSRAPALWAWLEARQRDMSPACGAPCAATSTPRAASPDCSARCGTPCASAPPPPPRPPAPCRPPVPLCPRPGTAWPRRWPLWPTRPAATSTSGCVWRAASVMTRTR